MPTSGIFCCTIIIIIGNNSVSPPVSLNPRNESESSSSANMITPPVPITGISDEKDDQNH